MSVIDGINTDPAKFFLYQEVLLDEETKKRAKEYSRRVLDTEKCFLCDKEFDLQNRAPRILVHCGHTFCTSCLYLYFKDQRIRCPVCRKVIKRLRVVEILPLNPMIHWLLVAKVPPTEIDPINASLKLPQVVQKEINDRDNVQYPLCEEHSDRYIHFTCLTCSMVYCRACLEQEGSSCEHHIIDLYSLMPDLAEQILERFGKVQY